MKILKNEKGITLIALVITIIVMIILSAIVMDSISSENGTIKSMVNEKNQIEEIYENREQQINELESRVR